VVNSAWSRAGLEKEGVPRDKIEVIALAHEAPGASHSKKLPDRFSAERPLQVLFLGQIIPRKGVSALLEAIGELRDLPIEFHFVGPSASEYESALRTGRNVVWHGAVPRDRTPSFYAAADVFVFPTLSDGFGLTQVEAIAAGVPVIASRYCGEVVRDGENGLILDEVSPGAIAAALGRLCQSPAVLATLQRGAASTRLFGIDDLYQRLASMTFRDTHVH